VADTTDRRAEPSTPGQNARDRADLEAVRDVMVDRLHRHSDDFEATRELRAVNSKLQRTSYGTQIVTASS
jgi:hypothetical protein